MTRGLINLILTAIVTTLAISCASTRLNNSKALVIQEQGSFAIGGTVVKSPGNFDPIKHGAFNPASQASEGQTLHGDHAYVFYQV